MIALKRTSTLARGLEYAAGVVLTLCALQLTIRSPALNAVPVSLLTAVIATACIGGAGPGLVAAALGMAGAMAGRGPSGGTHPGGMALALFAIDAVAVSLLAQAWRAAAGRAQRTMSRCSAAEDALARIRGDIAVRGQEAQRAAVDADRFHDELLETMSHELRTPMHAILGWARLLQTGGLDELRTARAVDIIVRNAHVEAALIDGLLDMPHVVMPHPAGRKIELEIEAVDTRSVVQSVLDIIRPMAGTRQIELVTRFAQGPCVIAGDRRRLQQIVRNLLSHAVNAAPDRSAIEIKVDRTGGEVRIRISDAGPGVNSNVLPRVLDGPRPAVTPAVRRHSGMGASLAIARHLVETQGGTMSASSDGRGRDCTFTIRFAAASPTPGPGEDPADRHSPPR